MYQPEYWDSRCAFLKLGLDHSLHGASHGKTNTGYSDDFRTTTIAIRVPALLQLVQLSPSFAHALSDDEIMLGRCIQIANERGQSKR